MKKKFMAVLLTGAMAVSMVSGITVKADEKESYTIGFSPYTLTNEYFTAVLDGVQKACDETGNELIYFDPQNDPTQQASQIDDMIASGIDALIYIPYDSAGAQTVLQTCKDAGVKVKMCIRDRCRIMYNHKIGKRNLCRDSVFYFPVLLLI